MLQSGAGKTYKKLVYIYLQRTLGLELLLDVAEA